MRFCDLFEWIKAGESCTFKFYGFVHRCVFTWVHVCVRCMCTYLHLGGSQRSEVNLECASSGAPHLIFGKCPPTEPGAH